MPSARGVASYRSADASSQTRTDKNIAVVTGLRREVGRLVKDWKSVTRQYEGRDIQFLESGGVALVCGGIGAEHARRATEAIITLYKPGLIVSAGFAGALNSELKVGDCLIPRWVIDAKDGSRIDTGSGDGVLVSYGEVAGERVKAKLAEIYGAQAVDMEAAAVARGAEAHQIPFSAVKVISDRLEFAMPPVQGFVDRKGQFQTVRFAAYVAIRPWLWKSVVQLGRNSSIASRVLRNTLAKRVYFGEDSIQPR